MNITDGIQIFNADCEDFLKTIPDDSIGSVVTDPPGGISFMGKDWDDDKGGRDAWVAWMTRVFKEVYRVMKPGAYGLVWAIPRTAHWTGWALESAGFYIPDKINHLVGTGFPKSYNIAKGVEGVVLHGTASWNHFHKLQGERKENQGSLNHMTEVNAAEGYRPSAYESHGAFELDPQTEEGKKWLGYETALKPAHEDWIMIQKPIREKNIASQVLSTGTGGLNISGCRIPVEGGSPAEARRETSRRTGNCPVRPGDYSNDDPESEQYNRVINRSLPESYMAKRHGEAIGRYPANVVLSHSPDCEEECCGEGCPVRVLDEQTGTLKSGQMKSGTIRNADFGYHGGGSGVPACQRDTPADEGGASRFYMCFGAPFIYHAKPSRRERNMGCEGLPEKRTVWNGQSQSPSPDPKHFEKRFTSKQRANFHPTPKSVGLMRYFVRLVTPHNEICLDPFLGSGTTGLAVALEGKRFIGIEKDTDEGYFQIAEARIRKALEDPAAFEPKKYKSSVKPGSKRRKTREQHAPLQTVLFAIGEG